MPKGCGQKLMLAMGLGLGFVALPVLILLVYGIVTGGHVLSFLIAAVMLLVPAIAFLAFGLREPSDKPVRIGKSMERRVLQMAAVNEGELTAAKLALGTQLRAEECQKVLEQFEAMGLARGHIGSSGEMRYTFPELQESMASDDDFMRRLQEEDPRTVLEFDELDLEDEIESSVEIEQRRSADD